MPGALLNACVLPHGAQVDALAWSVVAQSLSFLAGARGKLMELDAWRLHAADQQSSSGHSSRCGQQGCPGDAASTTARRAHAIGGFCWHVLMPHLWRPE